MLSMNQACFAQIEDTESLIAAKAVSVDQDASLTHLIELSHSPKNYQRPVPHNEQQLYRGPISDLGDADFTWYAAANMHQPVQ